MYAFPDSQGLMQETVLPEKQIHGDRTVRAYVEIKKAVSEKVYVFGAFIDIESDFNNALFAVTCDAAR